MNHIQQRTDYDCSYACIAMVCGVSLDDVMLVAETTGEALYSDEMHRIIAHFQHLPTEVQGDTLYADRVHIVGVPSLNFSGRTHSIVVITNGTESLTVFDPQEAREGKKFYDEKNLECWFRVCWIQNCKTLPKVKK